MQLGTPGSRGNDESHFQSPSSVITNAKGDIFITDGHAPIAPFIPTGLNMRVMKFDSHGKFLKQWGKAGAGQGEFKQSPCAGAGRQRAGSMSPTGSTNRIQIFDQDGKFLVEWKQFGRPSGFYITGDKLYAIDADSTEVLHPAGRRGVCGSAAFPAPRPTLSCLTSRRARA